MEVSVSLGDINATGQTSCFSVFNFLSYRTHRTALQQMLEMSTTSFKASTH
jgi:hypothetical protein